MSSLFGSKPAASAPAIPDASLRVQTSLEGIARTVLWGQTRVAGNLIWYGDFSAVAVNSNSGAQGGKGGMFGGGSGPSATTSWNYYTSVEIAIGEGTVAAIGPNMWANKALTTLSAVGLGSFLGSAVQAAWSYLTAQHPGQDFTYRNTAYVAGSIGLGTSASLPNWTFEVLGTVNESGTLGINDAEPTKVIYDFLTNANYGVAGWQSSYNGDWTGAQNYTYASGLLISYALSAQTAASSFLTDLLLSLNIMAVWSDAVLKLVPRGDTQITGNGHTYFPPTAPVYDLNDVDFLPNQAGFGNTNGDPVSGQRKPPRLQNNIIKVEYLDRANSYNPAITKAQDDGAILQYGERGSKNTNSWHWFQTLAAAGQAADLALGREQIANNFSFTLRPRYILLDPGDIVTITDAGLGLNRQWVRILDVQENSDRSLNFQAEEYLQGTAAAPVYGRQIRAGSAPNYGADPGGINTPIFFEPSDQLAGGLQLWAAISGINATLYGGCDAYASYDGVNYSRVPNGRQYGSARMGVTTASLATVAVNLVGQTIDNTNTLSVDLTESNGSLASGSQADALGGNTACWVGGEIISYQTATLTALDKYDLTYLVRGGYGTTANIVTHAIGTPFVRIDNGVLKIPFDQSRIGSTIYLKFLPFNVWGTTVATLATVPAFTYVATGAALAGPLPALQNLTTYYDQVTGTTQIGFDEIKINSRAAISYEMRLGTTLTGALSLGTRAHPPFPSYGDGTYWLSAVCQPVAGLYVHSVSWSSVTISGSTLVKNVVATRDEFASSWPGVLSGVTNVSGVIKTSGGGSGTYTLGTGHYINAGRVASCRVSITWLGSSQKVSDNILTQTDILNNPDILATGSISFVDVHPEISISQDGTTYSAWQRYQPGVYVGRVFKARMSLSSSDAATAAILLAFQFTVDVPDRLDTWALVSSVGTTLNQITVPSTGLTLVFTSNGKTVAEPFTGGPGTDTVPLIQITNTNATAFDFQVSSLTLSGCVITPRTGGVATTAPNTNISIQGW